MVRRSRLLVGLLGVAAFAAGCERPELPMSPESLSEGIVLFEHAGFLGNSAHLTGDTDDLRDFTGPCVHEGDDGVTRDWNDCISSLRVTAGWRVTLYRNPGYRGDSIELTEDHSNLQLVRGDCSHGGLNDCVSSVRIRRP
jgi:hypothetical protein